MSSQSTVQVIAQPIEVAPPLGPTGAEWLVLGVFIPFSAWVLWTSWRWRLDRLGIRSLDS